MAGKRNAEEVVDFALVPVRSRPDASHCWYSRMLLTTLSYAYLQTYKALIGKREKLIDDIKAWNTIEPIDRRHCLQKVVVELLFEISTDLYKLFRLYNKRLFRAELACLNDCVWQGIAHRFNRRCCCCGHTFTIIPYIYLLGQRTRLSVYALSTPMGLGARG